jgi:hypothetical protein
MTVNELIEQLKNYQSDMRVLTLGYEGGYDDINLKTKDIIFNVNSKDTWYLGSHDEPGMVNNMDNDETGTKCVVIVRTA